MLAKEMFEMAVKLQKETGAHVKFINLSGGVESLTNQIRLRMISERSVKVSAKYTKKYLFRPEWVMLQSIQRWDVS